MLIPRSGEGGGRGRLEAGYKPKTPGNPKRWSLRLAGGLVAALCSSVFYFIHKLAISFPLHMLSLVWILLLWARREPRRGCPLTQVSLATMQTFFFPCRDRLLFDREDNIRIRVLFHWRKISSFVSNLAILLHIFSSTNLLSTRRWRLHLEASSYPPDYLINESK